MRALLAAAVLAATVARGLQLSDPCATTDGTQSYFNPGGRFCATCPQGASYDNATAQCRCTAGHVPSFAVATTGEMSCEDCVSQRRMPSFAYARGLPVCAPCGNLNDLAAEVVANGTSSTCAATAANGTTALLSASVWSQSGRCSCGPGQVLVDRIGSRPLGMWLCAPCAHVDAQDPTVCRRCPPDMQIGGDGNCTCVAGTLITSADGARCIPANRTAALFSGLPSVQDSAITAVNLWNEGGTGPEVQSYAAAGARAAAVACAEGNATRCNQLANMCVLAYYSANSAPCRLYRHLVSLESCRGISCEVPQQLPWLHYLRSSSAILRQSLDMRVSLAPRSGFLHRIRLIVAAYKVDGTFLGHQVVTNQLQQCDISASSAREFLTVGGKRATACFLSLRWLTQAEAVFYDLFIEDSTGELIPVPALLNYESFDIKPQSIDDPIIFREAAATDTPRADGYKRRFYIQESAAGRATKDGAPAFVTYARRITLMFNLADTSDSRIYLPLLVVEYATALTQELSLETDYRFDFVSRMQDVQLPGTQPAPWVVNRVLYVQNTAEAVFAARTTLIVLCCVLVLTAFMRTYAWMRRQQDLMLGLPALIRFVVYYFNHTSNAILLFVVLMSWVFFVFYKYQLSVEYVLPEEFPYLFGPLYAAVVMKFFQIVYKIQEQTNADIFVIDWEKSKGVLEKSQKKASVSMWRSTFIANEFNEMQGLRRWHVLVNFLVIMSFLEGAGFIDGARSIPSSSVQVDVHTVSDPVLRVAVLSFFFIIVCLVFYILEWQIFHRFVAPHPLQSFVDLCSVSNISIMILLEPQWGYYIHGESIHGFADTSMEEFQEQLKQEATGNMPKRGLGGIGDCQTFEVYIGGVLRHYLYVNYYELMGEEQKALRGEAGPVHQGHHRKCFEFLTGGTGKPDVFTPRTMEIKKNINTAFMQCVRGAEKNILSKFGLHAIMDFPPNVMYMNGPFAGDKKAGTDLFFTDEVVSFGNSLLYGMDWDLFLFYLLFFVALDSAMHNTFASITITYVLELIIVWYRRREGEANIGAKTLFDDRFFL